MAPSRRHFLAAAAGFALLGGDAAFAQIFPKKKKSPDPGLINELLAEEHRLVFACGLLADSPDAEREGRAAGESLREMHRAHAAALTTWVMPLGTRPVVAASLYSFSDPTETAKDIYGLLASLERNLADAYLARLEKFEERQFAQKCAPLIADSVAALADLRRLLGRKPVFNYRDLR